MTETENKVWKVKKQSGLYLQERVTDSATGRSHYVSVKIFKDTPAGRADARERLLIKINSSKPSNLCLSDLFERCLAEQKLTVKQSTLVRNKNTYDRLIKILDDPLLSNLSSGYIRDKLLKTGGSATKLNEYLTRLKAALRWGYKNDLIANSDVIEKLYPFKAEQSRREKIKHKFLETAELTALLEGMKVEVWHLTTEFMVLSGLRFGEVCALNKEDISDTVHVSKTFDPVNKVITSPKTFDSNRDVFIQPELSDCIKRISEYTAHLHKDFGVPDHKYFLCDMQGDRIDYYAFNKYLRENGKAILGRDDITTHVLRHTHVSLLAGQGVPLDVISRRLGHQDSRVTKDIYFHITESLKERDNSILSKTNLLK